MAERFLYTTDASLGGNRALEGRTVVPRDRLLDVDVTAQSARKTWTQLADFLGRPVPKLACLEPTCRFPELLRARRQKTPSRPQKTTKHCDGSPLYMEGASAAARNRASVTRKP